MPITFGGIILLLVVVAMFGPHLVVLRTLFQFCTKDRSLLIGLATTVLGIEAESATCMASTLTAVLSTSRNITVGDRYDIGGKNGVPMAEKKNLRQKSIAIPYDSNVHKFS